MAGSGSEVVPFENFLIVLKEGVSVSNIQRVAGTIDEAGGKVLLVAGNGRALVITGSQLLAEGLRRLPYVHHVGGVRINQRQVVRRQV